MRVFPLLLALLATASAARADVGTKLPDPRDERAAPAKPPPRTPRECGLLAGGEGLRPGEHHASCDGRFDLTLQPDGDLVLSRVNVGILWSSHTEGRAIHHLVMQDAGTLALVDGEGRALWQSHPYGIAGSYARLQDDGDLGVYDPGGRPLWHTNTAQWPVEPSTRCGELRTGEGLVLGQQLRACDGQAALVLSPDGDLILRVRERVAFSTGTAGSDVRYLRLDEDGALGLYGAEGEPVWSSEVRGFFAARAVISAEGALVVVAASGDVLWSSAATGR